MPPAVWLARVEPRARVVEITNRADGTLDVFRQLVNWAATQHPDVILGAGTIYDAAAAAMFVDAGANFIVSPIVSPEVARFCNRRRVAHLPGCGFTSGVAAVGVGGSTITDELQRDLDPARLASKVRELLGWVRSARA